ncbi:MAG: UDP-glucose 4-epimerase [Rhodothermales bacterium]|jgi:UDP-glucose 4-epimerase
MKVFITGGAGFIGSHIAERLVARGDQVLIIDNFATGRRDNVTPGPNLELVEDTIADKGVVDSLFDRFQPDVVVHAAASYKDPNDWEEDSKTNVMGSANLASAAARTGCSRLIYFQTALCYGLKPLEQPITLDHPILPDGSSYAISKTAAEQYIRLSGVDFISFRLANAYGPRNLSGPLPTFYHRLSNDKPCFVMDTRRDFIFINDLVDVVILAIDGKGENGAYHVSSGSDYSIKELFDATLAALEIELEEDVEVRERSEDDVFTILIDPSKTNQDFDWATSTPLGVGVAAAIAWYREFGITQTFTHLKAPRTDEN